MALDTRLRETMRSHADNAPSGADLLDGVRGRHTRSTRRRRVVGVAALVLVVTASAYSVGRLSNRGSAMPPATVQPVTQSLVRLVPSTLETPYFPYQPSWLPPGVGKPRVAIGEGGAAGLTYSDDENGLSITLGSRPFPRSWEADDERNTSVNGIPAKLQTGQAPGGPRWYMLAWPHDDKWVTIFRTEDEAQVMRIANGLKPGRVELPMPLKLTLMPEKFVINRLSWAREEETTGKVENLKVVGPGDYQGRMELSHPMRVTEYHQGIDIDIEPAKKFDPDLSRVTKTKIGGRDAWTRQEEVMLDGKVASVGISITIRFHDFIVTVSQSYTRWLSDADMLRFAEGITFTKPKE